MVKIDAYFSAAEVDPAALAEATVVVVDVLRATTSIVEALASGARGIYPTASTEEAVKLAHSLGREDTLLCGERKGEKVEGFDLGNSPREFTREQVGGKRLVMSTTNGTRALIVGRDGARLLACAFTNLSAAARALDSDSEIVVLCAGRSDQFSLEDALCAGHLIAKILQSREGGHALNDAARAARMLAGGRKPTRRFLAETWGGQSLIEIGLGDDLDICAEVDRHDLVAELRDQAITRAGA
jgi:2-phosphosulfolactate phosphatase